MTKTNEQILTEFREKLRKVWSFDENQRHTHNWHSREDFIEKELPSLLFSHLEAARQEEKQRCLGEIKKVMADWSAVTDVDNPVSIGDIEQDLLNAVNDFENSARSPRV